VAPEMIKLTEGVSATFKYLAYDYAAKIAIIMKTT